MARHSHYPVQCIQESLMKPFLTIGALALATAALQFADVRPAFAVQQASEAPAAAPRKITISKGAQKPLAELQTAVNANDVANIPAKLAAAQAAAKSADEKLLVAQLQLKASAAANDEMAEIAALNALIASGGLDQAQTPGVYVALGKLQHKNKQFTQAATSFERVLAINPGNTDALIWLAENRNSQGQVNEAVALLQRALQAKTAAGQKADEAWYKRAIALAYNANLPSSIDLSRQWVAAYPSPANWRDALRVYRKIGSPDSTGMLDALRLARATDGLEGDSDFFAYASGAETSSPGEARAVLDEAIAAKKIDPAKPMFKDVVAKLKASRVLSLSELPQLATEARGASTARLALRVGDAYYGYGDYAKAVELYRAALTKTGADANLVNLHLGMALARSGDKAGATTALKAVAGPQSELAKFWLVYLATHA
ncbi:MAG: tetratricopeptide repeat protein [Sphingomicrobium sp.]